jgi:hypothetical protein
MVASVRLKVTQSNTTEFTRTFTIACMRYAPYYLTEDKLRWTLEIVYILFLIAFVILELLKFIRRVKKTKPFMKPEKRAVFASMGDRFCYLTKKIATYALIYLHRILFGFLAYISGLDSFLTVVGIVANMMCLNSWRIFSGEMTAIHEYDWSNPQDPRTNEIINHLLAAGDQITSYRRLSGFITGVYCLRMLQVVFKFFPKINYFWETLLNSFANNLYFLFFICIINLGVSLFAHLYFGSSISEFNSLFKSFIVIFGTILGYTQGIDSMLRSDPVLATVVLEVYYFLVIMILLNMFIIFVNSEYKSLEEKRKIENAKIVVVSSFDYTPFFGYRIVESIKSLFTFRIYYFFKRDVYNRRMLEEQANAFNLETQNQHFKNTKWDSDFQRFVDIDFRKNESLARITSISAMEIDQLLRVKQFGFYWSCIGIVLLMVLHTFIVLAVYYPTQVQFNTFYEKTTSALMAAQSQAVTANRESRNGDITSIIRNEFQMRMFTSEIFPYWFSRDSDPGTKPLFISQSLFPSDDFIPLTDYIVRIKNVKLYENDPSKLSVFKIAKFNFLNHDNGLLTAPVEQGPNTGARDLRLNFTLYKPDILDPTTPIKIYYEFDPSPYRAYLEKSGSSYYVRIPSNTSHTDPYFVKLVNDNLVGPETMEIEVVIPTYNNVSEDYAVFTSRLKRNDGDHFSSVIEYTQFPSADSALGPSYLMPLIFALKAILQLTVLFFLFSRVRHSLHEYNIWYKIEIENFLPAYLLHHRNRKNPELLRKLSSIISPNDILLLINFVIFSASIYYYYAHQNAKSQINKLTENTAPDSDVEIELFGYIEEVESKRFLMSVAIGFEVIIITVQIILSLTKVKLFKVVLKAFAIILDNLTKMLIIMTSLMLSFTLMLNVLLGDRYTTFSNPLRIDTVTGILINLDNLRLYTDGFDTFVTLVFLIPYFLLIKYTVLYMIIAIIYSSISTAKKMVEDSDTHETKYLSFTEFWKLSIAHFSKFKEERYGVSHLTTYISRLNYSPQTDVTYGDARSSQS